MSEDRQLCAVCGAPIKPGLLMCAKHWRLVPLKEQQAVLVTYGHWKRNKGGLIAAVPLIAAYRTAREVAVASARGASQLPATGDFL